MPVDSDDILTSPPSPKIETRPVVSLRPRVNNPRTHSPNQIRQIARSIEQFGFRNPILIDEHDRIVAGHGRMKAAKLLRLDDVPVIRLTDLSEAEIRAYVIADNKIAANAGWDEELVALELQYLSDIEIDIDVSITGFETPEIDILIDGLAVDADPDPEPVAVADPGVPAVSQAGDLWQLGHHRLLCGDSTDAAAFEHLMADHKAQMVFTDPPYNTPIDGHVRRRGQGKARKFAMASGEMSQSEFTEFLRTVFDHLAQHSVNGSLHFVCIDWRHLREILCAGHAVYSELLNLIVWSKTAAGLGVLYRSQHELILLFKNGAGRHVNNVQLGKYGRNRSNVWTYPGLNTLGKDRDDALARHPTAKPVPLVAGALRDCSQRGGIVLDPFAGSGTTIIAAEKTGRRAFGMELDPTYVDTAIARFERETGHSAVHADTGETFSNMKAARATEADADGR